MREGDPSDTQSAQMIFVLRSGKMCDNLRSVTLQKGWSWTQCSYRVHLDSDSQSRNKKIRTSMVLYQTCSEAGIKGVSRSKSHRSSYFIL